MRYVAYSGINNNAEREATFNFLNWARINYICVNVRLFIGLRTLIFIKRETSLCAFKVNRMRMIMRCLAINYFNRKEKQRVSEREREAN
jgi:hypothetical protein